MGSPITYAQHSAWDFCGQVWLTDCLWHEEIWVYGVLVEIMTGKSLEDLISDVNDKYGLD